MSLGRKLVENVMQLGGVETPHLATASLDAAIVSAMLIHWSPLAVSVRELSVTRKSPIVDLQESAARLANRLAYLNEPIRVLELDSLAGLAQLRSSPPKVAVEGIEYFEILLAQAGSVTLRRYAQSGDLNRIEVEATMTLETLGRVIDDLAVA